MTYSSKPLLLFGCLILSACGGNDQNTSSAGSSQFSSSSSSISSRSSSSSSVSVPSEPWLQNLGPDVQPVVIDNGVTLYDSSGEELHAHGAGIIQVGDEYYWYGENRYADQSFKSVTLYRSRDLKNWSFVNDILTDKSDADLSYAKIERPKIIYNENTREYVMWMHKEGGDNYGQARAAVASSPTIDGDYTYHGSFRPLNHMSRDCTAFVDDDGAAYFLSAANENADLHLYRLSADFKTIDHLVQKIWVGQKREAPALLKRNGHYILITSGTSGWDPNQARYGYARSLAGSWSATIAVGNGTTFDSQPTYILPITGSKGTSYLYMGDRWLDPTYQDSKYVWLPIEFKSDTSIALNWSSRIAVDVNAGVVVGSGPDEKNLISKNSQLCLDVSDESTEDHANIIQWTCTGKDNQQWTFNKVQNNYYQVRSLKSGKCLDVVSASTANGANIVQWTCNQADNQLWERLYSDGTYYSLRSKNSGKCVEVADFSGENGGNIQQGDCTQQNHQLWRSAP